MSNSKEKLEHEFSKHFSTKTIKKLWYCYGTYNGYDHSYCSDNEEDAIFLAKKRFEIIFNTNEPNNG